MGVKLLMPVLVLEHTILQGVPLKAEFLELLNEKVVKYQLPVRIRADNIKLGGELLASWVEGIYVEPRDNKMSAVAVYFHEMGSNLVVRAARSGVEDGQARMNSALSNQMGLLGAVFSNTSKAQMAAQNRDALVGAVLACIQEIIADVTE